MHNTHRIVRFAEHSLAAQGDCLFCDIADVFTLTLAGVHLLFDNTNGEYLEVCTPVVYRLLYLPVDDQVSRCDC